MTGILSATVYYLLYLAFLPVTVLGYVIWVGGAIVGGRGSGVSGTAQGPLSARFFEHKLGVRQDDAACRLMVAMPNVPPLGLNLFTWPMLLAHRVTGFVPKAFRYPFEGEIPPQYHASARMTFYDAAVERYLTTIDQFVILGAGFDTRAFRLPDASRVRCFEVDTPATQSVKRDTLRKAGIDSSHVTFVSADFERDDWLELLVGAGFDMDKPALFLWEGVMVYLDSDAVEATLRKIASTAKGSAVAFDYFTTDPLTSKALYWRYARMGTSAVGEPLKYGIDSTPPSRERIAELLESCGLSLGEQVTLGREGGDTRAWGGFAVGVVE